VCFKEKRPRYRTENIEFSCEASVMMSDNNRSKNTSTACTKSKEYPISENGLVDISHRYLMLKTDGRHKDFNRILTYFFSHRH
jgi:hypothetical protein